LERNGEYSRHTSIDPAFCLSAHNIGRLVFPISNAGRFGSAAEVRPIDCFTATRVRSGEFPADSRTIYLYKGGLWVGGVVNGDTLVSTGADFFPRAYEFFPDVSPFGDMKRRSTIDPFDPEGDLAVSEQDLIAVYTDTFTSGVPNLAFDQIEARPHVPLNLEITQRSFAWSYEYAEDIVLMEYTVKNLGRDIIEDVYVGLFVDADIHLDAINPFPVQMGAIKTSFGGGDDLTGFLETYADEKNGCEFIDTISIAWAADNDGDGTRRTPMIVPHATGLRFLKPLGENEQFSYNWWSYNYNTSFDFGPQKIENFRFLGGGTGTPFGDRNKYAVLSNGEIDYDQAFMGNIEPTDQEWVYPNAYVSRRIEKGRDISYLLSLGPFTLRGGSEVVIPMAYMAAESLHVERRNWDLNLSIYYRPEQFYNNLDFSDLVRNANWASWIYDNPGVDTDGDGDRGKFRVCVLDSVFQDGEWQIRAADTTYYAGDGIPDWRAASPPPAPKVWVMPTLNGLHIRFNGKDSETSKDIFTRINDFEGYRVYMSRDSRETSYSLVATYDRQNFDILYFNWNLTPEPGFSLEGIPVTLEELRCRFGSGDDPCNDLDFNPHDFTMSIPWVHPDFPNDSLFYFIPHDFNASEFGLTTDIVKRFPDAPEPGPVPDSGDYTEDGYLKYYEYEFSLNNMLPTVDYFVNVTAFDFGSPETDLKPLETSKTLGAVSAYPASDANQLTGERPAVYIYPNPYRVDDPYRKKGFEGRTDFDRPNDRVRAIHFENLPPSCTISIFSLDGDLIRRIDHDMDPADPNHTHDTWNLITRNTQAPVSGLYYWTVEEGDGTVQIGKLIIIM
jgi:hypothetical protein